MNVEGFHSVNVPSTSFDNIMMEGNLDDDIENDEEAYNVDPLQQPCHDKAPIMSSFLKQAGSNSTQN